MKTLSKSIGWILVLLINLFVCAQTTVRVTTQHSSLQHYTRNVSSGVSLAVAPLSSMGVGWAYGWTAIPNTNLGAHTPAGCSDGFTFSTNAWAIVDQWSGGVADTAANRLLIFGGGHGNGYDNGVYSLNIGSDVAHSSMTQLVTSTCVTNWGFRASDPAANGLRTDGSGPCATYSSACSPNARQTYDGLVYDPVHNKLITLGGVPAWNNGGWDTYVWELDLSTLTWTRTALLTHGGSMGMVTSSWNPNNNTAWYYDGYILNEYNPVSHTATVLQNQNWSADYHQTGIIDPVNNVYWIVGNNYMQYIPLSSTGSIYTATGTGCGFLSSAYPGLTWNSKLGKVVAYPWTGNSIYIINYNGTSTTCTQQTFSGATVGSPDANYQGTFERFQYLPSLDVYVLCNNAGSNCYVLNTTVNSFSNRIAGTNVPGGASSILSSQSFDTMPVTNQQQYFQAYYPSSITTDCTVAADGCSLKFSILAGYRQGEPGWFDWNFSSDLSKTFGQGQEFFVQYRMRVDPLMLQSSNFSPTVGDGWKMDITTEGDTTGGGVADNCSNTPGEWVLENVEWRGYPQDYHNCSYSGGTYAFMQSIYQAVSLLWGTNYLLQDASSCQYTGGNSDPPCFQYTANEWMTVQKHIKVGTWGQPDSVEETWIAHAGSPARLTSNAADAAIVNMLNGKGANKYGKISLGAYNTNMCCAISDTAVWYDDLIASTRRIPDPDVSTPNAPDSLSVVNNGGVITISWRVNSQNGTAQDDTGFYVERCSNTAANCFAPPQSGFSVIYTTLAGANSYQDNPSSGTYTYRVRAKNANGNSAYTAAICFNGGSSCGGTVTK